MPKAQQMSVQYILSILKKILECQMQLKHPRGDENLTANLWNIKSPEFLLGWEQQHNSS